MKAVVQRRYGPIEALELRDVEEPRVSPDEVLVRVRAASVHPDVWHVVTGEPYVLRMMGAGLLRPTNPIPGTDVAGVVAAVGSAVTGLAPGDEVLGETITGHPWTNGGAFAEYVAVRAASLAPKPAGVTFEQAAAVPTSGYIALVNLVHLGGLEAGQRVLVNGAGGCVGSLAVQLAKAHGAHVTAVDGARKLDFLRALGADRALDHAREDFTRAGERYDLVLDIPGNHPFSECRRALTPRGRYVLVGHHGFGAGGHRLLGPVPYALKLVALSAFTRQLPGPRPLPSRREAMASLVGLLAAGKLAPVVARTYPLAQASEALRALRDGQPLGRIVLST